MENFFILKNVNKDLTLFLAKGRWKLEEISNLQKALKNFLPPKTSKIILNFENVKEFDTAGIILLLELQESLQKRGLKVELILTQRQKKIVNLINLKNLYLPKRQKKNFFYIIGEKSILKVLFFLELFEFIGKFFISFFNLLLHPSNFRFKETIYHIEKSGFDSLFIIGLTSILVGLVVAYQSIVQLAQFGADIFVIDAIGISITRELGPMISAIVIAGRSASSYTAEIGTMKLTEEISAMETMGFDPYYFLVIPRVIALAISMPLVIFFADVAGIFGGMIATNLQGGISIYFFLDRLQEVLDVKHYILGIVKGPFFAILIALTGVFHGLRVTNDTESIGIETTSSVVNAIFLVIAADALFSIIYTKLGL